MTNSHDNCIAVRLRTAKSEPVTPIAWVSPAFAEIDHLSAPSMIDNERTNVRYDIVKRERVLIGDTLVHELNLSLHDPRPTTLKGHVMAWWRDGLVGRRTNQVPWIVGGALVLVVVLALVGMLGSALLTFFAHPFESMIWIWVKLGRFLVPATVLSTGFLAYKAWRNQRPFYFGMAFGAFIVLPVLAYDIRAALFSIVSDGAKFPEAYGAAGQMVLDNLVDKTANFYTGLSAIWEPLTILLNGVGLAGVVAFVDNFGGWGVTQLSKRNAEGESPPEDAQGTFTLQTAAPLDGDAEQPLPLVPRFHVPQFTLKVPLEPLADPNDHILERPERCC